MWTRKQTLHKRDKKPFQLHKSPCRRVHSQPLTDISECSDTKVGKHNQVMVGVDRDPQKIKEIKLFPIRLKLGVGFTCDQWRKQIWKTCSLWRSSDLLAAMPILHIHSIAGSLHQANVSLPPLFSIHPFPSVIISLAKCTKVKRTRSKSWTL
jgi:hypothetical protein